MCAALHCSRNTYEGRCCGIVLGLCQYNDMALEELMLGRPISMVMAAARLYAW